MVTASKRLFYFPAPLGVKFEKEKTMTTEEKKEVKQEEVKEDVQEKASAETKNTDEHMVPKSRIDQLNLKLADEKKRADALEKAAIDKEEQQLKDDKRYKELYEKSQQTITELKPKADKLETAEATLQEVLDKQIALIPEDKRSLIPAYGSTEERLRYIADNGDLLRKAAAFDYGAADKGGKSDKKSVVLTAEQKGQADKTGVSHEEYAKHIKQ